MNKGKFGKKSDSDAMETLNFALFNGQETIQIRVITTFQCCTLQKRRCDYINGI